MQILEIMTLFFTPWSNYNQLQMLSVDVVGNEMKNHIHQSIIENQLVVQLGQSSALQKDTFF